MIRQIYLTGKNSNEVYTITFPTNIMNFCKYDFTLFMERCVDLCKTCMKSGIYKHDDVIVLRNSISKCHRYYEQNMRGIFDKIVIDCWIEYICRQNNMGTGALWNAYINCRNDFEKAVFSRLSEYRRNQATNQWVNLLRLQEYAQHKVDFVFGTKLSGPQEAANRADYFDLLFNVAANELGFPVEELGVNKVYTMGRLPNSPFVMSSASREIVRNTLSELNYDEGTDKNRRNSGIMSDRTAMDAFSVIKNFIPSETDPVTKNIIRAMGNNPRKVYVPAGFKGCIDLEIDALIESGAIMQRCARCGEYFVKDEEYNYDYCSRPAFDGRTCLDISGQGKKYSAEKGRMIPASEMNVLGEKCEQLYKEMSARINVNITQRDFSDWYQYMQTIRDNVVKGIATMEDFDSFVEYSHSISFAKPHSVKEEVPEKETEKKSENGKKVKPFVFQRIDSRSIDESYISRNTEDTRAAAQTYNPQPADNPQGKPVSTQYQSEQTEAVFELYRNYADQKPSRVIRGSAAASVNVSAYEQNFDNEQPAPTEEIKADKGAVKQNIKNEGRTEKTQEKPTEKKEEKSAAETEQNVSEQKNFKGEEKPAQPEKAKADTPKRPLKLQNPRQSEKEEKPTGMDYIARSLGEKNQTGADGEEKPRRSAKLHNPALAGLEKLIEEEEKAKAAEQTAEPAADSVGRSGGKAKALSAYKNVSAAAPEPVQGEILTPKPEPDFADILKGIDRNDGFEEIDTDAEGMPVSHKTKHVMDALFKPSKASPVLNIRKDDSDRKQ